MGDYDAYVRSYLNNRDSGIREFIVSLHPIMCQGSRHCVIGV